MPRPLRLSRKQRIIAGVCGGIAEGRGWNPTLVRVLFVLIALFPLIPGILVYVLLWLLIPRERAEDLSAASERPREGVR